MSASAEKQELLRLQACAAAMQKDTFAYKTLSTAISAIADHIRALEFYKTEFSLKVKVGENTSLILNRVPIGCTLLGLKQMILGAVAGDDHHPWLHRNSRISITLTKEGKEVLIYDDSSSPEDKIGERTLEQTGLRNNDVLTIAMCTGSGPMSGCATSSSATASQHHSIGHQGQHPSSSVAQRQAAEVEAELAGRNSLTHGHRARSALLAVALALHLQLTRTCGFICMETAGGKPVPGFAPSLRELPSSRVVPIGWDADRDAVSLTYKHKSKPGALYVLIGGKVKKLDKGDGDVQFCFSKKIAKGSPPPECCKILSSVSDAVYAQTQTAGTGVGAGGTEQLFGVLDEASLFYWFEPLIEQALPGAPGSISIPAPAVTPMSASGAAASASAPILMVPAVGMSTTSSVYPGYGGLGSDTNPDLAPNMPGNLHIPSVGSDPTGHYPAGGGHGNLGGMLVGPDSDLFRAQQGDNWGVDSSVSGYPQAPGFEFLDPNHPAVRYDPLLPPGPGLTVPVPGRGERGGRGGRGNISGRGMPRAPQVPGEPNPDHLKPPGW